MRAPRPHLLPPSHPGLGLRMWVQEDADSQSSARGGQPYAAGVGLESHVVPAENMTPVLRLEEPLSDPTSSRRSSPVTVGQLWCSSPKLWRLTQQRPGDRSPSEPCYVVVREGFPPGEIVPWHLWPLYPGSKRERAAQRGWWMDRAPEGWRHLWRRPSYANCAFSLLLRAAGTGFLKHAAPRVPISADRRGLCPGGFRSNREADENKWVSLFRGDNLR